MAIDLRANVAKTVHVDAHAGTVTSPSPSHAHANGRGLVHVTSAHRASAHGRWEGMKEAPYLDHENLDVDRCASVLDPTPVGNAKMLLARIVAMLTKMTR